VTVVVPRRFNGPPDSANGGYTCGLVADLVDADVVQVSLRAPPPLETELEVEREDGLVKLVNGEAVVADGRPARLDLDAPAAIDVDVAERASREGFDSWSSSHPFPTCVICGPERGPGDGYEIFPGRLGDGDLFAATWTPDPSLAGGDGLVRPECVWGGLDCPTSAPVANWGQGPPVVLAQLTASIDQPVHVGRPHVLVSWPIEIDGRKRHAGVALFDSEGTVLASARALWIQLRE
jgi:hypothetical protein